MADGLCECGCRQRTRCAAQNHAERGWVRGEPIRFVTGHNKRVGRLPVREDHGYATPCLIWQGRPNDKGYGKQFLNGRARPAHVAAWERVHGPVPEGHEIDHLCFVRMCVNLEHLECVTTGENRRRASLRRWHGDK